MDRPVGAQAHLGEESVNEPGQRLVQPYTFEPTATAAGLAGEYGSLDPGSETGTDDPNVAAPVQEDDTENSAENSNIENGGLTNAELDLINEE